MEEKKRWERPQLIVLGQGKPEENVLTGCKNVLNPVVVGTGTGLCAVKVCKSDTLS